MKSSGWPLILGAWLGVAGLEIAFHWLLGTGRSPTLLAIYLDRGNSGKAFNAGIVDNQVPAVILGWISGWVGYSRWSLRTLGFVAIGTAISVAALVPLYRLLVGPGYFAIVWGAPRSLGEQLSSHAYDVFTAFLAGGAFTYGGYVFRRDWKGTKREL